MQQDYDALTKYTIKKKDLDNLLAERETVLDELRTLVDDAILISSLDAVYHFDVTRAQEVLVTLAEYEVKLFHLVDEVNNYGARCAHEPIPMFSIPRGSSSTAE